MMENNLITSVLDSPETCKEFKSKIAKKNFFKIKGNILHLTCKMRSEFLFIYNPENLLK
ncbi:hypothetical protein LEP1GSC151_2668 [Leptospira interrogans serovar Grippotyphosa str. LT2186]|uniref:Uncharacterized protein n=1 Tax=Leptospira interrogans serovar Grippotyphosa str. LT2186 TaxID=1001599 RepID=M3HX97_LEPIR|nr:hypothetical protein LEP1GSC151_2668 [Leptospira interrogans serovar Grippotyphosa str. LT2186]